MPTAVLRVGGMHCASCVSHVEDALTKLEGVRSASVNLMTGKAVVEYDPERVSTVALSQAIDDAGYQAGIENTSVDSPQADGIHEADFKIFRDALRLVRKSHRAGPSQTAWN
jgi:copper ion binding protein